MSWSAAIILATGLFSTPLPSSAQQGVTKPVIAPASATSIPVIRPSTAMPQGIPATYTISPDDSIQITVWKEPTLSGPLLVRPDGMITVPLLGDVPAAGLAPEALSRNLTERLKKYVSDPLVTVTVLKVSGKEIFMLGEVGHVGPLTLTPNLTLLQAISAAGGLTPYAHSRKIYILRSAAGIQQKIPFDYKKALSDGDPKGFTLLPGDTIVVP